jgi:hypothetical protein
MLFRLTESPAPRQKGDRLVFSSFYTLRILLQPRLGYKARDILEPKYPVAFSTPSELFAFPKRA